MASKGKHSGEYAAVNSVAEKSVTAQPTLPLYEKSNDCLGDGGPNGPLAGGTQTGVAEKITPHWKTDSAATLGMPDVPLGAGCGCGGGSGVLSKRSEPARRLSPVAGTWLRCAWAIFSNAEPR
jgi:hypothetical protein